MSAHCERFNLTAVDELYAVTLVAGDPRATQRFTYDRPEAILSHVPESRLENLDIGDCVKDMQKTIDGYDFNGEPFRGCEGTVRQFNHDDYNDYVCRNYPEQHKNICHNWDPDDPSLNDAHRS